MRSHSVHYEGDGLAGRGSVTREPLLFVADRIGCGGPLARLALEAQCLSDHYDLEAFTSRFRCVKWVAWRPLCITTVETRQRRGEEADRQQRFAKSMGLSVPGSYALG